jgi:hypothetical protein
MYSIVFNSRDAEINGNAWDNVSGSDFEEIMVMHDDNESDGKLIAKLDE